MMDYLSILRTGITRAAKKLASLEEGARFSAERGRALQGKLYEQAAGLLEDQLSLMGRVADELEAAAADPLSAPQLEQAAKQKLRSGMAALRTAEGDQALRSGWMRAIAERHARRAPGESEAMNYAKAHRWMMRAHVAASILRSDREAQAAIHGASPAIQRAAKAAEAALAEKRFEDPSLKAATAPFLALYERLREPLSSRFDARTEVLFREEAYGQNYFSPADNTPEMLARAQGLLDRLSPRRARQDLNYQVRLSLREGIDGSTKGGDWIELSKGLNQHSDGRMATVIAHELTHLEQRHLVQTTLAEEINKQVFNSAAVPPAERKLLEEIGKLAILELQRGHEFAADAEALRHVRALGLPEEEVVGLLAALRHQTKGARLLPEALDDHPSLEQRIAAIERLIAGA